MAVLAALLVAACGQPPTVEELMAQARQYQQKGDLKASVVVLKNVLQQDPGHGEARFLLGMAFGRNGEPRWAEHYFREALKAKYRPEAVLPPLARSLFEQAEFAKLLEATHSSDHGEAALQPEVLSLRGHSQVSLGRLEDADRSFEESLKRRPEYAPALLGKLRLASLKRDAGAANDFADRAIAADPASLDAWLLKGDLDRASGKTEAALADYQKALALNPKGLAANLNLASLYMETGKLDLARKHVEAVVQASPNSAVGYYLLGLLEFRSHNLAAANEAVQKTLKAMPNHLPATVLAGAVAYSAGANEQAEKRLEEAVSRYPSSAYLRKLYAAALLKSRKAALAIQVLEPAVKAAPSDPGVLTLYAEAKFQTNDIASARKYFELAAKRSPANPVIRKGLGLARLAAGETEKALADLEAAVDLGDSAADAFLVRSLLSVRRYDQALEAVTRLESRQPRDPATFNLKGAVLFARGDTEGARKAFERAIELGPSQFAAAMNLAQLDTRDNNPAEARKRFERILERDKANVAAMLALSDLALAGNDPAGALAWIQRARQANPKAFAPTIALARLHFARGDYAGAVPVARDALAARPDSAEALNILAYAQLRLGHRSQALETYRTLAARHPKSAEAHYGLGGALSADGQVAAAVRSLEKALQLRPQFPEAMYALAALQLRAGKVSDARKLVADAQKRMPKSALAFIIAGDAAMAEKRYDQAARAYENAFAVERSRAVLIKYHTALRDAGRTAAALSLTAEWLERNPRDLQVRYAVADTAIRSQDFRLAAEQYRIALESEPNKLPLLHNLAGVYERLNDPRALEVAEAAHKVAPNDPGALHDLGRLLVDAGKIPRAIEVLEKARMLAPDAQLIRYQLARAYATGGDNARARAELEHLLRGRQEFAERAAATELLRKLRN